MANRRVYFWATIGLAVFCILCVALPGGYFLVTDRLRGGPTPAAGPAASFTSLTSGRDASNLQAALEFSQADAIHVFFDLVSPQNRPHIVKGRLLAVAVEGVAAETELDVAQETFTGGSGRIHFDSSRPWPLGNYRIDMAIDNQPAGSLEIAVVGTNTSGAQLQNAFTSLDQAAEQRTDTFPTAGSIFVHFTLANAPRDTFVQGILVAENASGLPSGAQITETNGRLGDGAYWFEFFNDGPWPVGEYVVYIYLNGQFVQQIKLNVQ
jgi:hypothetical protein